MDFITAIDIAELRGQDGGLGIIRKLGEYGALARLYDVPIRRCNTFQMESGSCSRWGFYSEWIVFSRWTSEDWCTLCRRWKPFRRLRLCWRLLTYYGSDSPVPIGQNKVSHLCVCFYRVIALMQPLPFEPVR